MARKYFSFWHIHYGFLYRVELSFRLTKIAFYRTKNEKSKDHCKADLKQGVFFL